MHREIEEARFDDLFFALLFRKYRDGEIMKKEKTNYFLFVKYISIGEELSLMIMHDV